MIAILNDTRETVSLAGAWRFSLDATNTGIREAWYSKTLTDTIELPGTTDEAKKGELVDERCDDRLSRVWRWIGPAWYQRTLDIPERWSGKRIRLFLERTKDSQVWVDGTRIGSDDSLSTPHVFDLSDCLSAGSHQLTILVDNAKLPPVGPCHQVDERTQTNWNGIVGRIELQVTDPIWVDAVEVYPRPGDRVLRVKASIRRATSWGGPIDADVRAAIVGDGPTIDIAPAHLWSRLEEETTTFVCDLSIPEGAPLWDEFRRPLVQVTVDIAAGHELRDSLSVTCGIREFTAHGNRFLVNGRPVFLRGKHDAALFPLTGYAPMSKADWLRHLGIAREWGMNHFRFHSWCPPEAAFEAADELGIYLQVELPNKRPIVAPGDPDWVPSPEAFETLEELLGYPGDPTERTRYLIREGERILAAYGNHPSFVMMTLGNELDGDEDVMRSMCNHFRELDGRHLYSLGTHHHNSAPHLTAGDDFWVTSETAPDKPIRGASFQGRHPCHVDNRPPSTLVDYTDAVKDIPIPVIAHEMYEVFPDFTEIPKYSGVTRARNLEIFRDRLEAAGMLDQAADFVKASGALSAICHREDVEAALRTKGFGGFHMLDLQDFSGQGTALVGMLNVFMESKGLITAEEWRQFCSETVPLLGIPKYTWTSDEILEGSIKIAHYGPADLVDQPVTWEVTVGAPSNRGTGAAERGVGARDGKATQSREVIAAGRFTGNHLPTGAVTEVGTVRFALSKLDRSRQPLARKIGVTLELPDTPYRNTYDVWVYPSQRALVNTAAPTLGAAQSAGATVVRSFDAAAVALEAGKRVLLLSHLDKIKQSVGGAFQTSFWCWPMFRRVAINAGLEVAPGTNGFLCDPDHPLFDHFPTEFHSNWQWWRLVKAGRPLILDSTPTAYRPLVQVIDNFARNHKLGLICEAKVGKGRLLICAIDLPALTAYPEARQLRLSIDRYMAGEAFDPAFELDAELLRSIV